MSLILILIVIIAVIFDYTNGVHDSGNAIAPLVSTKVMDPKQAVIMAAVLNLVGAFIGTEVAATIGKGIVNTDLIAGDLRLVLAALLGAIFWNVLTWVLGLPSSSSHALIGGLMGAAIAYQGWHSLNYTIILHKIIAPLFLAPVLGLLGGYLLMLLIAWLTFKRKPHKMNKLFKKLQIVSGGFMALSHGSNDAQKCMGIITLALFLSKSIPSFEVPFWVKLTCASAITIGTATGGWKIIKTMGNKIFKMEPIHGFTAQTSASLVIIGASFFGAPISTTHVMSSSIMGVGASKRASAVRWNVAGSMVFAWFVTIPAAAVVGALCYWVICLI
jgi:inorganic phosphate transporter, PiT family